MSDKGHNEIQFIRGRAQIDAVCDRIDLPSVCREGLLAMATMVIGDRLHGVWGVYATPAAGIAERYAPLWRDDVLLEPGGASVTTQDLWTTLVAEDIRQAA